MHYVYRRPPRYPPRAPWIGSLRYVYVTGKGIVAQTATRRSSMQPYYYHYPWRRPLGQKLRNVGTKAPAITTKALVWASSYTARNAWLRT